MRRRSAPTAQRSPKSSATSNVRYPGIRFRIIDEQGSIRQHIKFFVNGVQARDLSPRLAGDDEVMIVCALTGG